MMLRNQWKKEWIHLVKKETKYLKRHEGEKETSALRQVIEEKIPEKLEDTLRSAFAKAFDLVFEKGTGIIEKTYDKNQQQSDFQTREYAAELYSSRKNIKAFGKKSKNTRVKNLAISGAEGVSLGLLGIGVPDIPVFTAVILKSVYEIALSYGFEYESKEEQWFILKIIETALLRGSDLEHENSVLNDWIDSKTSNNDLDETITDKDAQSRRTSDVLAEELLFLKFLQGIPVVGIAGGISNTVYLKKITEYAELKYRRRFLKARLTVSR